MLTPHFVLEMGSYKDRDRIEGDNKQQQHERSAILVG
jgi:hypothetical protein